MQIAKAYGYNCKHIINLIKPSMQRCPSGLREKLHSSLIFKSSLKISPFVCFSLLPQKLFNFRGPQLCTLNHANCFKVAKIIINLIKPSMQRCPSGLRCSPGKAVCGKPHRGFESLFLRQTKKTEKVF